MKHINFFKYILLCIITCTHYSSDALYSDGACATNQLSSSSSTQLSAHASAMAGAPGIFRIVPALTGIIYGLYKWWQSDDAHAISLQKNSSQASQTTHVAVDSDHPERCRAYLALQAGIHDITTRSYAIDHVTRSFLRMHELDETQYVRCTGNVLEHALHEECVSLVHDTAYLHIPQIINKYQTTLARAIDAGRACVHAHDLKHAVAMIDWAHSLYRYLAAAIKGAGNGLEETVETFAHPYSTCKQFVGNAHRMVRCTLRMIHELGLIETLIDVDNDALIEAYLGDRGRIISAAAEGIKKQLAMLSGPDATQKAVAAATQAVLTGQCLGVLLGFFTYAAHQAPKIINMVEQEKYTLALAVDSGVVSIAQEAAQLSFSAADKQILGSKVIGLAGAYKPLADELEHLRKMFADYLLDKDKTLVHVFEGEMDKFGKLGGLHHDYLGYLEAQGRIRVLELLPNGMYRAEVWFNGKWEKKSFFPKHWTREEVCTRVSEILKQPHKKQIGKKSKIIVQGFIEQTAVRIVLTPSGKIITCYPDIIR